MTAPESARPAELEEPLGITSCKFAEAKMTKKNLRDVGYAMAVIAVIAVGLKVGVGIPDSNVNKKVRFANHTSRAHVIPRITLEERITSKGKNASMKKNPKIPADSQARPIPFRFEEHLQPYSKNVMAGYSSCGDLIQDVQHALESLANEIIESSRNIQCGSDYNSTYYMRSMKQKAPSAAFTNEARARPSSNEDSFGTYNQVEGVDEADNIKSNGKYVFMGYGRELIVLDLMGNVVDRVEVPVIPSDTQTLFVEEDKYSTSTARKGLWPCENLLPRNRTVVSLLMHEDDATEEIMLNVMTTSDDWTCCMSLCGQLTTAFIYQFSGSTLNLVASHDINGSYSTARAIGSMNNIISSVYIDTGSFASTLDRCSLDWSMTYEQYEKEAFAIANETVASYAQDIVNGLLSSSDNTSGNSCENIVQISSMTTGDEDLTIQQKRSVRLFYGSSVLQNFVQITSFDLESVITSTNSDKLGTVDAKTAGAFLTSYSVYVNSEDLILLNHGWRYERSGEWHPYTCLLNFDLSNGIMAVPKAVGNVTGYAYSQLDVDIYQDSIRVATRSLIKLTKVEDELTGDVSWEMALFNSSSQVTILQENGHGELTQVGMVGNLPGGFYSFRFIRDRGYLVTYREDDPLYLLDFSNPVDPKVLGKLNSTGIVGQIYPISGGNGTQVGDYLLTVGWGFNYTKISLLDVREITKTIEVASYEIDNLDGLSWSEAAYDFYAFRYLEEAKRLIIPYYVYKWNNHYYDGSVLFDGFVVYDIDISNKEISVAGIVTHYEGQDDNGRCWGEAKLPSRSMVFKGDLMTFTTHSIKMTNDFNGYGEVWPEVNLDEYRTKEDGCYPYRW